MQENLGQNVAEPLFAWFIAQRSPSTANVSTAVTVGGWEPNPGGAESQGFAYSKPFMIHTAGPGKSAHQNKWKSQIMPKSVPVYHRTT